MTDDLPTRSFTALPPPPAGAAAAVRGGRGIRRRRRLTGAGAAAASMAVIAGVLVAAGTGTPHASDELVPAAPRPPSVSSVHGQPGSDARDGESLTLATPRATAPAAGRPRPTSSPAGRAPQPSGPPTGAAAANRGGYRTPALVRRYHPAPAQTGGPSGRICGGGSDGDTNGNLNTGYGFCLLAYATRTARGHDLVLELCRDSTGPGSLRFARQIEAELVVHDVVDNDRIVWRWSTGQPDADQTHVLEVETSACWTWTAPWTDVDAHGHPLDVGKYEVAVTSTAQQLRSDPAQRAALTVS